MNLLITILLFAFAAEPVITGTVTDDRNDPLPGVHVFVQNGTAGTVTNASGRFELRLSEPGEVTLVASMVGYARHTQLIDVQEGVNSELDIRLSPITLGSGEVVVTAGRRAQVAGNAPVSVSTISAQEIETRNIRSLDESLRYVPGVQMAQNQVNIRGSTGFSYGTGSRVLLLVDGVPMMGPDQNDIKFDALPMAQVERVEIVKGPGSALYGSGALGGVINLITKDFPEQPESQIRPFSGWYEPVVHDRWKENWDGATEWRNYHGLVFSHARSLGQNAGFWISGLYQDDSGYLEQTTSRSFQLYGKFGFRPAQNIFVDIYGGYRFSRNRQFLYWNGLNDPLRAGRIVFSGEAASGANYLQSEHYSLLPTFRHIINDRFFYTIRGRAYAIAVKPLDSEGNIRPSDQHTTGLRYGAETEINWSPVQNGNLISGASFDDIATESEFFIGQDDQMLRSQPELAFFSQYDQEVSRNLTISAGLRYDAYRIDTQDWATRLSPKLNVAWSPTEALTLRGAYGHGFRVPAVSERFVNNRDFLPLEPNLDLRPEESVGYEIGVHFVRNLFAGIGFEWDTALFWNDYDQLIEPRFEVDLAGFQFVNLTEARIRGVETTTTFLTNDGNHQLRLGYTYLDHRDLTEDEPLTYRSDHQLMAGVQATAPFAVQIGADYRYLSKPDRVDSDFSIFVPDADAMTAIHVVDARVFRDTPISGGRVNLRISASVNNLLNYYYVERPAYLAPPRSYEFGMQVRF